MTDLADAKRRAVDVIYGLLVERGVWPTYAMADKRLDQLGLDSDAVLKSLGPGVLRGAPVATGGMMPDQEVQLSLGGVALATGSGPDLELLAGAVRWLAERERLHDPEARGVPLMVMGAEILDALGHSPEEPGYESTSLRLFALLDLVPGSWAGRASEGIGDRWNVAVDRAIRRYRDVASVENLLRRCELTGAAAAPAPSVAPATREDGPRQRALEAAANPSAASRLRIYGDGRKFRRSLANFAASGAELLDQADGASRSMEEAHSAVTASVVELEWTARVEQWRFRVIRGVHRYLASSAPEALPVTTTEWPPDTGHARHARRIGWVSDWLGAAVRELSDLAEATGPAPRNRSRGLNAAVPERLRRYDVALSFAGEQRAYVEEVATHLRSSHVTVFYDGFEEIDLWGRNLYDHLAEVYGRLSRYVVVFASEAYAAKVWPNHERQHAQARAIDQGRTFILPVRFDATEIPGLASTVAYLDATTLTPRELAVRIVGKVRKDTQ